MIQSRLRSICKFQPTSARLLLHGHTVPGRVHDGSDRMGLTLFQHPPVPGPEGGVGGVYPGPEGLRLTEGPDEGLQGGLKNAAHFGL